MRAGPTPKNDAGEALNDHLIPNMRRRWEKWWALVVLALLCSWGKASAALPPLGVSASIRVYIYDLPDVMHVALPDLTDEGANLHDGEREMHEWLLEHPARTRDPCDADLFFLPIYWSRMVQVEPATVAAASRASGSN